MNKLWIFGDSYGHLDQAAYDQSKDWHWIPVLAKQLVTDEKFITISHFGAPNEWIYYQVRQHLDHISSDDYVVVISTQFDRRWFFPENIGASNLTVINDHTDKLTNDQKNAARQYLSHLTNPLLGPLMFEMFCYSLHYLTVKKNLNLLIIPGFEENGFPISGKYNVTGSLFDICKNEVKGKTQRNWHDFIAKTHQGMDPRIGHLSQDNHLILAEKIKNTFLNNDVLDLTTNFKEEILG